MRKVVVPSIVLFALAVGIWLGYGAGIDHQFKRDAAFQGFLLSEFHAALVDEGDAYVEALPLMLEQADSFDRSSDSNFDPASLNLLEYLSGTVRTRIDDMRSHTDDYLRMTGVRGELVQSN